MSKPLENWNFEDVGTWLNKIGLGKYEETFLFNEVDGPILSTMTENDVRLPPLAMTKFGDIRKFGIALDDLKTTGFTSEIENGGENQHLETDSMADNLSKVLLENTNECSSQFQSNNNSDELKLEQETDVKVIKKITNGEHFLKDKKKLFFKLTKLDECQKSEEELYLHELEAKAIKDENGGYKSDYEAFFDGAPGFVCGDSDNEGQNSTSNVPVNVDEYEQFLDGVDDDEEVTRCTIKKRKGRVVRKNKEIFSKSSSVKVSNWMQNQPPNNNNNYCQEKFSYEKLPSRSSSSMVSVNITNPSVSTTRFCAKLSSRKVYSEEILTVCVSHVESPTLFYLMTEENRKRALNDCRRFSKLYDEKNETNNARFKRDKLKPGIVCSARFPTDREWYRGKIIGINVDNDVVDMFFVDFGNASTVSIDDVRPLPKEFAKYGPLCLSARLKGFETRKKQLELFSNGEELAKKMENFVKPWTKVWQVKFKDSPEFAANETPIPITFLDPATNRCVQTNLLKILCAW